jgi:adenylate cyclase class IV
MDISIDQKSHNAYVVEREIKIDANNTQLRDKLLSTCRQADRCLIIDSYYDVDDVRMLDADVVLRVRQIDEAFSLAYKGKRSISDDNVVDRLEYELSVENGLIHDIVKQFFVLRDVVEKYRTTIVDELFPDLTVYFDHYPFIGDYIEVEGETEDIRRYVKKHQVPITSIEARNCTEIFLDYCEAHGLLFKNIRCALTFTHESGSDE